MLGKFAVIFVGLVSDLVTVKTDVTDLCRGTHCKYTVNHTHACTQDRYNSQLFSRKNRLHGLGDRGLYKDKLCGQVTQCLVCHKASYLAYKGAKILCAGVFVS